MKRIIKNIILEVIPEGYSNSSGDEMMASATELFKDFRKIIKKLLNILQKNLR